MQYPLRFSGVHKLEPQQLDASFQVEVMRSARRFDLLFELGKSFLQQLYTAVVLPCQFGHSQHFLVPLFFLTMVW